MKVLAFTNLYPSVREPTRGLFNLSTFRALAKFCQVRVVAPVAAWKRIIHPADLVRSISESRDGIVVTYPTYWSLPRVAPQFTADALYRSVQSHVEKIYTEFPFDAIVGTFAYPDVVAAARLATVARCPLVAMVLGSDINVLAQRRSLRASIREALVQASTVIAVSEGLRDKVIELGIPADRIVVQYNGVDGERFMLRGRVGARRQLGIDANVPQICFIGNLVLEKGPDVLVEALGRPELLGLDVRVVLIGDGGLRDALRARIAELGLSERVSFLGRIPPDEVALWISSSDLLCLPSRREGCPNVVLEALASGRPVVAAAVGGVPELVDDDNGILVPFGDPAALAVAIASALQRSWDPSALRATVPSLSWNDMGSTVHTALSRAVKDQN